MSENYSNIVDEIEEIKNKATFALAKQINLYGLTLSESRLFSLMFLEDTPMTLDDMSKSLGMSKTSMSTGIHSLQDAKMVEQTWKKGIRKDLYKAEENLYTTFANTYLEQWFSIVNNNKRIFSNILRELNSLLAKVEDEDLQLSLKNYSQKIQNIIHFYLWLEETFNEMKHKIDNLEQEN